MRIMAEKVDLHIVTPTAVIINGNVFIAGRRAEDAVAFPGMWQVVGGKVEGEDGIEETLRKEIKEEAGVEVGPFFYIGNFEFTRPDRHHVIGIEFGCEYISGELKSSDPDMVDVRWMTVEEAKQLNFIPGVLDYVKKGFEIYRNKLSS